MISASLRRLLVLAGLLALPVSSQAQSGAASIEVDVTPPSGYVVRASRTVGCGSGSQPRRPVRHAFTLSRRRVPQKDLWS